MTTTIDETAPDVSFGCTVDDVLRLLPGVQLADPVTEGTSSASYYQSPQVRKLAAEDVEAFIQRAGSRVQARIYRYEQIPDRVQEHIRTMARDLVAVGAAWFLQSALHPAASGPNNLSSSVADLRERFETDLDEVRATIQAEIDNPSGPVAGPGQVSGSFPDPLFPDEMRF